MTTRARPGDVIAGKYRVERILGEGGMGVVVAATHLELEQLVALKFLLPEAFANPEAMHRFGREARAAAKIKSEHVARILDTGRLEDGSPYQVMEYLEGDDLSRVLEMRTALSVEEAVSFILQASEALAEAHAAGIVHRDLKPANLFLARRADRSQIIKVLDFGISKNVAATGSEAEKALTKSNAIVGSPYYMSPEQLTYGRPIDARADIWALGIILYELLSGKPPFGGETLPQIVAGILSNRPRPIGDLRPDVPPMVTSAILRCMQSEPDDRFASVAELAAAIAPCGPPGARESAERMARVLGVSLAAGFQPTLAESTGPGIAGLGLERHPDVAVVGASSSDSISRVPIPGYPTVGHGSGSATAAPWSRSGTNPGVPGARPKVPIVALVAVTAIVFTVVIGGAFVAIRFLRPPPTVASPTKTDALDAAAITSAVATTASAIAVVPDAQAAPAPTSATATAEAADAAPSAPGTAGSSPPKPKSDHGDAHIKDVHQKLNIPL